MTVAKLLDQQRSTVKRVDMRIVLFVDVAAVSFLPDLRATTHDMVKTASK